PAPSAGSTAPRENNNGWRERIVRPSVPPSSNEPPAPQVAPPVERAPNQDWRGRAISHRGGDGNVPRGETGSTSTGSDVPRRVIDGIGGARIYRGDSGDRGSSS